MSDTVGRKLDISIGNILYSIFCRDDAEMEGLKNFIADDGSRPEPPDCSIELSDMRALYGEDNARTDMNKLFEADLTWGLYETKEDHKKRSLVMTVPSLQDRGRSKIFAKFDHDFRNGTVYARNKEEHYFFYPFLEVLTINLLAGGRGSLLHACCVNDGGTGYLFIGQSGAGKSTIANLWNKEDAITILSDDRVLVSMTNQGLTAYGTPWHGTERYAVNAGVTVGKIFFISHAEKSSASEINGIVSVSELVRNAFLPFWDRDRMQYATEFLISVSKNTRLFRLGVCPDKTVIDLVRNV